MVGWFAEMCGRRGLKVNAGKNKMMVLNGEVGVGMSLGSFVGDLGSRANILLVLRECIWNELAASIDDTGSLGPPTCQVVYPPD